MEKNKNFKTIPVFTESKKFKETDNKRDIINSQINSVGIGKMKRSYEENISENNKFQRKKIKLCKQSFSANIVNLPDELLIKIFLYLEASDIMNISLTCLRMSNLTMDSSLWKIVKLKSNLEKSLLDKIFQLLGYHTDKLYLTALSKKQHAINLEIATKISYCRNLTVLHLNNQTLDASEIYITSFPQSLKELSLANTNMWNNAYIRCFFNRIDVHLINLEALIFSDCRWFVTHSIMILSRIPKLKCLKLDGCVQLQDCMPYVSLSTRYGFKSLEEIDLRRTFMSDNEVSCFNVCKNLRNLYLARDERLKKFKNKAYRAHAGILTDSDLYQTYHTSVCLNDLYNIQMIIENELNRLKLQIEKLSDIQLQTSREMITQELTRLQRMLLKACTSKLERCEISVVETDESSSSGDEVDNSWKMQTKSRCFYFRQFQQLKQCLTNFKSLINQHCLKNGINDSFCLNESENQIQNKDSKVINNDHSIDSKEHNMYNNLENIHNMSDDSEDDTQLLRELKRIANSKPSKQNEDSKDSNSDSDNDNQKPGCSREIQNSSPTPGCSKDSDNKFTDHNCSKSLNDRINRLNSSAKKETSTYCGETQRFISIVTHPDRYSYDLKKALPADINPQVHDLIVIERITRPENSRQNQQPINEGSNILNNENAVSNLNEHENGEKRENKENSSIENNNNHSVQNRILYDVDRGNVAGQYPFYIHHRIERVERPIRPPFLEEIEVEINQEHWPNLRANVGLFTYLSNTITDRTVHALFNPRAESRSLERLSLNGYSHITDTSLLMIGTSETIRYLDVRNTAVTQRGCDTFRNQHPECEFLCNYDKESDSTMR